MNIFSPAVSAQLSAAQQQAFAEGADYFNTENCGSSSSSTGGSLGSGSNVFILGDSISERSQSSYQSAFQQKGVTMNMDAQVGRSLNNSGTQSENPGVSNVNTGMQAISLDTAQIKQANAVIVALGTNGGDTPASIDQAIQAVKAINSNATLYWVDTIGINAPNFTNADIQAANTAIYSEASKDGYTVISWFKVVDANADPQNPSNLTDSNNYIDTSDGLGVHPDLAGVSALTSLVVNAAVTGNSNNSVNSSNPSKCCNSSTPLTGTGNGVQAFNYLVQKGLSQAGAAGVVGNMTEESTGVDPERLENNFTGEQPAESPEVQAVLDNGSYGWGIVQWTPPSTIITKSTQQGQSLQTVDTLSYQLDFLWNELNSSYQTVVGQLKSATSPTDAATAFLSGFERGNPSPERQIAAQAYYDLAVNGTPLPQNLPVSTNSGGSSSTSSSSTTSGSVGGCSSASNSGYQNPYRDVQSLTPMRIDEGVDYGGNGPVYALGNGTVVVADNGTASWPGNNYVSYKLTDGAYAGQYVYIAENCTPAVSVNSTVTPSTIICTMHDAYPYTESGWSLSAQYNDTPLAHCDYIRVPDGTATAYGYNFNQLLVSLGAPSGTWQFSGQTGGNNLAGSLPSGWPNSATAQAAPNNFTC